MLRPNNCYTIGGMQSAAKSYSDINIAIGAIILSCIHIISTCIYTQSHGEYLHSTEQQ